MKTKYVVEITVELSERLTKKAVRAFVLAGLDPVHQFAKLLGVLKVRVRNVDED